ncbi:hypothetical protein PN499_19165 [Kamptonema animale CS-326]|jgi:hypothetical protein|uniref:heterocyst-inhibiting protein PatX n=1 Tax=Kamptonema animale TaxID=92934 RepID=UPI00232BF1E6|nr:hypothetical protein [Kamptonema animale]MDB9513318.1 hypothetical protein [Kamptonema animale CS-326]
MKTYTAIIFFALFGISFAANAQAIEYQSIEEFQSSAALHMLSAQTQQKGERAPERGSGRRDFIAPNVYSYPADEF